MDIIESLKDKVNQEKLNKERAIVFWYDPAQQILVEELQATLQEDEIVVRELTANNFFKLKVEMEVEKPNQSYLIYAPFPRPKDQENYLLDILLYSAEFKADEVAVLAEKLAIKDDVLRPYMERYPLFFRSQERKQKLSRILSQQSDSRQLEIAILAIFVNAPMASVPYIVRKLLLAGLDEAVNEHYKGIAKNFSLERLWELVQQHFGISVRDKETPLKYLLETLLYQHFKRDSVTSISEFDEKYQSTLPNICALLIDDWMRADEKEVVILENYIKEVELNFAVRYHLQETSTDIMEKATTFPAIDLLFLERVIDELQHKVSNLRQWKERIQFRRGTYWGKKDRIAALYNTLFEAVRLTEYKTYLKQFDSSAELFGQYANQLHFIDQAYRRFMRAYTALESREIIDNLAQGLTNWYENVYLMRLAEESNRFIEENQSSTLEKQKDFFESTIQPILEKETTKVFVIISDALRYESGIELGERLNQRVNGQATVSPLFASLPSYTQLGMASLLPNQEFSIKNKVVYTDGKPTNGLINRTKVLQQANEEAIAFHLDELLDWKVKDAEENLKGKRIVYLYHDIIDAIGDSRKSEKETYEAVDKALHTLELAVDRLSKLQAKRIFITSDHGFLFQLNRVKADGKVPAINGEVIDHNRRFVIGKALTVPEGAVKLKESQSPLLDVEVVIAKGLNRFMTGGGLQFIHGGAMPQEVIIPLVDYRRTQRADLVDISVAMLDKNITNFRVPVSFYQEQSISTEYLPRQLKTAFYQKDERISNEVVLVFDMVGENQKRNKTVSFTLAERYYNIGEKCTLRLETISEKKTELYKEETFTIRMYDVLY